MTTRITDLVLPANFAEYIAVNSTETTGLWTSGVVQNVPTIAIPDGGRSINVPMFQDLDGDAEVLSGTAALTLAKVTATVQVGMVNARGRAFAVNDLATGFSGADPVGHIGNRLAAWWERVYQRQLLSNLRGITAVAGFSSNVVNISGGSGAAGVLNTSAFIDAEYAIGDARASLNTIVCNSATKAALEKLDQGTNFRPSETLTGNTYRGKQVIEIDSLAPVSGVHTLYMVGPGAFGFAEGMPLNQVETDRNILAGDTMITTRRSYVLHPMGFSYTGAAGADGTPADAAYADAANWSLVVDRKLVRVVAFRFRLS